MFSEKHLSFSEKGINSKTEYGNSEHNWNLIQKIVQNRKFIYLYISKSSAYVIPKKIFKDQEDSKNLYNFVNQKWLENK